MKISSKKGASKASTSYAFKRPQNKQHDVTENHRHEAKTCCERKDKNIQHKQTLVSALVTRAEWLFFTYLI